MENSVPTALDSTTNEKNKSLFFSYHSKFSTVELHNVRVVKASNMTDWEAVERLRSSGFSRYPGFHGEQINWIDDLDRSHNAFSLLASGPEGEWRATMRVQDGRNSKLELCNFIDLDSLLAEEDLPAAQFSRLSVRKGTDAIHAMAGLFKAGFLWCQRNEIASIICATPRWSYPIYQSMSFSEIGGASDFMHNFGAPALHKTMILPVKTAPALWRRDANPMLEQFLDMEHPNLSIF